MHRHTFCRGHLEVMSHELPRTVAAASGLSSACVTQPHRVGRAWAAAFHVSSPPGRFLNLFRSRQLADKGAFGRRLASCSSLPITAAAAGVLRPERASPKGGQKQDAPVGFIQTHGNAPMVVLKRGKVRLFKDGQPMVYSGAVDRVVGRPAPVAGDCVMVADGAGTVFGWGVYNPTSMFRVRMMQLDGEAKKRPECCLDLDATVRSRLTAAATMRGHLNLPSRDTTVYRLCNSEGDHLSGLVVDVLGAAAVVSSSAAWVERKEAHITECLLALPGIERVVWRRNLAMLAEEGASPEVDGIAEESSSSGDEDAEGSTNEGGLEDVVQVSESSVLYSADLGGQKTGFYADQRDNRAAVAKLCAGKRVLDLCCYSGGFAISAALNGASSVTAVDSSGSALELGKRNAELNGVTVDFVKADIKDFMQEAVREGQLKWDVIVLDPPKLAPSRKSLNRATNKYRRLNADAMRLFPPEGGLLLTCTCSGAMTQSGSFQDVVKASALAAGKQVSVLRVAGCGMDHPVNPNYPEGNYLTTLLVSVRD